MKINSQILLLILINLGLSKSLIAQDKYPSLLWEISGNGLEKPSYLYGTMHVSSKLAFHLTDDFFESIQKSDIVALESDPTQWLDETEELEAQPILVQNRFYRQFTDRTLDKYSLAQQLASDHQLINGLLYRSNSALQDFQEDTYLDMFIFQAGSRFNKPIVGLENFKESRDLVAKAYEDEVVNTKPPVWLEDLLKEKNYDMILKDSYRNNNLDMIDSLNIGFSTPNYLEYMLFKRNDNMIEVYDSIIQNGKTIFAGVGAAHLPGEKGMIEGFRKIGYTVKPIIGKWTSKGEKAKAKIEDKRKPRKFSSYTSSDGVISFSSPTKVHEVSYFGKSMYLAPDLTNGSYIAISRMKLNDFAKKENQEVLDFKSIDKILIEYIPGTIESKTNITTNGIKGLDIKTVTKSGDHHRYAIYKTALEFIIFKMVGKNNHVLEHGDKLFNSIQFHISDKWKTIEPLQGGFSVEVPGYFSLDNNSSFTTKTGNPLLQAYQESDNGYYFVKQKVLNDHVFLEKDSFELHRIQDMYFKELKIDSFDFKYELQNERLLLKGVGETKLGQKISLMTVINGGHYYLLGSIDNDDSNKNKFYNSFRIQPFQYTETFEEHIDSALYYKVNAPKVADKDMIRGMNYSNEKRKDFESKTKIRTFNSIGKTQIYLKYHRYNHYDQYRNIDSLWNAIVDFKVGKTQVVDFEERTINAQKDPVLNLIMMDTATTRKLLFKYIIHGGVQYKLSAILDTKTSQEDQFIKTVFDSFIPLDTLIGKSPIQPKAPMFFDHLYSEADSLRKQATSNYNSVLFFESDRSKLVNTIENFDFKDDELEVKVFLITAFSELNSTDSKELLSKWYLSFRDNADIQIHILKLLAKNENKADYKKISDLINQDIPLPYQNYKIANLFHALEEYPDLEKQILKDLMGFLSIGEYQDALLKTLATLFDTKHVDKGFLKKYKKQILAIANVELKRSRSEQIAKNRPDYTLKGYNSLSYLVKILQPFRNESEVKVFYDRLNQSEFPRQKMEIIAQLIKSKSKVDENILNEYAKNRDTRYVFFEIFNKEKIQDHFPKKYASLDSIGDSFMKISFKKKKDDKVEYFEKHEIIKDGKEYIVLYYKLHTTDYSDKEKTEVVYGIFDKSDYSKVASSQNTSTEYREEQKDLYRRVEGQFILSEHPRAVFY